LMRRYAPGQVWLLPVRFADCEPPSFHLGAGRTLDSIQRVDLFDGSSWELNIARLVTAVRDIRNESETQKAPSEPRSKVPETSIGNTRSISQNPRRGVVTGAKQSRIAEFREWISTVAGVTSAIVAIVALAAGGGIIYVDTLRPSPKPSPSVTTTHSNVSLNFTQLDRALLSADAIGPAAVMSQLIPGCHKR
jgi:hypothetical protein